MIAEKPGWIKHGGTQIFSIDIQPGGLRFATGGGDHKEEVQRQVAEELAPLPGTLEERIVTAEREQEIYKEVAKVNPKGRVLGQGCLSQLYVRRGSRGANNSYSGTASIRDLEARLKEKEEEHARYKEEHARKAAARDEEMKVMKDQMIHFASFLKELSPTFARFDSSSQLISLW